MKGPVKSSKEDGGVILAAVGLCGIAVAGVYLLRRRRNKRFRGVQVRYAACVYLCSQLSSP